MDFESLVERLKESLKVDGMLLLGSTGQSTLNAQYESTTCKLCTTRASLTWHSHVH